MVEPAVGDSASDQPPAMRRTRGRDPLGLRRVLSDRLLPCLVAAMALLAALALAGASGAAGLAARWETGAATAMTVQLPTGPATGPRLEKALLALRAMPEVADARAVDQARLAALLRPWLDSAPGDLPALPLPAMLEVRLAALPADPAHLAARIVAAIPGAAVETQGVWVQRLVALSRSVETMAVAALLLVAGVATAVVAVAVRAGIVARRDAIAILHAFGATDADVAGRFARRVAGLVGLGALAGALVAVPLLVGFANLAAPLLGREPAASWLALPWGGLPWVELVLLPPAAAGIGWVTAQATLRVWLRRLP